jgi:two-component system chemotaxis response regulator CheB
MTSTSAAGPGKKKTTAAIVVIGASAGGRQALVKLLAQLDQDFPAPILIVQHMAATASAEVMVRVLGAATALRCQAAVDGAAPLPGHVYVALPDQHMMLVENRIRITKGARENRARPAIDPLFRSAAVAYGNRVIAVVLSGYLDDGTAGMEAVHRCGGLCVVQDPLDAEYPDMPQNVVNNAWVDRCVPIAQMGAVLLELAGRKRRKPRPAPRDVAIESRIAERVLSDLPSVEALGTLVPFNCPGCGGVLWQVAKSGELRYRCHTGHAYTAQTLLAEQTARMEETLWVALRMFEENRNLLVKMEKEGVPGSSFPERLAQSGTHIARIRAMLHQPTGQQAEPAARPRTRKK